MHQFSTQCLKIPEKVSFNFASEASYVYILNEQKFIKNTKTVNFGEFLKMRHFEGFSNTVFSNCEFETSLLAHIFSKSTFNYSEETQPTQVSTHDLPGFEKMNSNFQKLGGVWR